MVSQKKVFVYPPYTGSDRNPGNLYLKLFEESFSGYENLKLVRHDKFKTPFWNLLYYWRSDIFFFSWVEGLVYSFSGKMKFLLIALIILVARWTNRDVIWILHNKHPHKGKTWATTKAMRFLAKYSTVVVTHSQTGITYFNSEFEKNKGKCYFIPHPVYSTEMIPPKTLKWDYIIWGEILPRKGILEFLRFANSCDFFKTKKILVCGRCKNTDYSELLSKECNNNVTFINEFIHDDVLREYVSSSRYILFPYQTSSVLSSGSLVYSLNYGKPIIGPNVGVFAEMDKIVTCYDSFEEIIDLHITFDTNVLMNYIEQNNWNTFLSKVLDLLENRKSSFRAK